MLRTQREYYYCLYFYCNRFHYVFLIHFPGKEALTVQITYQDCSIEHIINRHNVPNKVGLRASMFLKKEYIALEGNE